MYEKKEVSRETEILNGTSHREDILLFHRDNASIKKYNRRVTGQY